MPKPRAVASAAEDVPTTVVTGRPCKCRATATTTLPVPVIVQRMLDDTRTSKEHKKDYAAIKGAYADGKFRPEHKGMWVLVKDGVVRPEGYASLASAEIAGGRGCTAHQIGCEPPASRSFFTASLGTRGGSIDEPLVSGGVATGQRLRL